MALSPGSNFGSYRVIEPLGRGGMATVHKAYEPGLDRYVALKVLPAEFLHDPDFAVRFKREAKVIAKLEHPRIVPLYAFGIDEGIPWMAMRLVAGGTVSSLLKEGRLDHGRAVAILGEAAEALEHAHRRGILHRDVKPQNLLLDEDRHVYLADFGIAKMVEGSAAPTKSGMITGTPQYMSPEQAQAKRLDPRTDIYALGVIAFEMFTGRVPFSADTPVAVLLKHISEPIPLPSESEVQEPLMRVVLKCLAKDAGDRWESATEFTAALAAALGQAPRAYAPSRPTAGPADLLSPTVTTPPATPGPVQKRRSPTLAKGAVAPELTETRRARARFSWGAAVLGTVALMALLLGSPHVYRAFRQEVRGRPVTAAPSTPGTVAPRPSPTSTLPTSQQPRHSPTLSPPDPPTTTAALPKSTETSRKPRTPPTPALGKTVTDSGSTEESALARRADGDRASDAPSSEVQPDRKPPSETRTTPAVPTPEPTGLLQVGVMPWAEVSVDGAAMGTTPLRKLELPVGIHTVELRHPEYKVWRRKVSIRAGATTALKVDLSWEGVKKD